MMNLFSRCSGRGALAIAASLVVGGQIGAAFLGTFSWFEATSAAIAAAVLAFAYMHRRRTTFIIRQAIACCQATGRGDFEKRIDVRAGDELGDLLFATNDLIDRVDAFVREAAASMEFASRRKFFRRIIETGMVGSFLDASRTINSTTQAMQDEAEAAKKIEGELGGLVALAAGGDFTQRIDTDGKQGFHLNVSMSLNELVETVDRGLAELGRVLQALAESDLTQRIEGDFRGAFLQLKTDTNRMVEYLSQIVSQIRDIASSVQTATSEISVAMDDLSKRSESQAASLEQTAAATQEITETVKNNADNAGQANELAASARTAAKSGSDVVTDAIATMAKISEFSDKITTIAGVIDDIAFQTSLLALNAGVEAARAGDSGRGFAVVASEVRALSQRSSAASNEVKSLIGSSVQAVQRGVERVNRAGTKLGEITAAVDHVAGIVSQISTAGREQSAGLGEVNMAVSHMDEMTQQNAALLEQVSAASESLKDQISSLVQQVQIFRLSNTPL